MHKKPMHTREIIRVVFQEDGPIVRQPVQNAQGAQEVQNDRVEQQVVATQPVLRSSTHVSRPLDKYVPSMD